jgi:23S rRNA G2069 N7-methylase RlmK/C1962 C5-methylase RlmI
VLLGVRVVAVDSSLPAIEHLGVNLDLNRNSSDSHYVGGYDSTARLSSRCEALCMDVDEYLRLHKNMSESQLFDVVVCDPPKFADSKASVKAAARK